MLDKLRERTDVFKFMNPHEIEFDHKGFLISGEDPKLIESKWMEWIKEEDSEHPNNYFDYISCFFDGQTSNDLNINLLLDRSQRFHSIKKIIPKSKIQCSFSPFSREGHQYIIVDKDWFNFIRNSSYSTYAMIDFIGVRDLITKHGEIPYSILETLNAIINEYAIANPSFDFLTCADNIIVKTNWLINEEANTYTPEYFIKVISELMKHIEKEIHLLSYVIITQGANYVNENGIRKKDRLENHFFMPSISVPFIEAFEIDTDARKRIRNHEIEKSQLYIENSFYISLNRKYTSNEEPSWLQFIEFSNSKYKNKLKYIGVSFEELSELVELQLND
jgi:hypothetical protein